MESEGGTIGTKIYRQQIERQAATRAVDRRQYAENNESEGGTIGTKTYRQQQEERQTDGSLPRTTRLSMASDLLGDAEGDDDEDGHEGVHDYVNERRPASVRSSEFWESGWNKVEEMDRRNGKEEWMRGRCRRQEERVQGRENEDGGGLIQVPTRTRTRTRTRTPAPAPEPAPT